MRAKIYSTKHDSNIFKIARANAGLKQIEVAEILGIVPSTVSKWESGVAIPDQSLLPKVADLYGVSVDELLGRQKNDLFPSEAVIDFPVLGSVRAGMNGNIINEEEWGETRSVPAATVHGRPQDYFVLRVRGNSMYPEVLDGDCVLVHKTPSVESGSMAVVLYNSDCATVKWVRYVEGEDWVELIPNNTQYAPVRIEGMDLEECRILGEVVDIMRKPRKKVW